MGGPGGGNGPNLVPGAPRHWEPGLPVNDYSVFNLSSGNLLTSLTLVSWDPVGPPVDFTIYHNSCSARDGESGADGQGFDLGDGWSTSYSGRIVDGPDPDQVTVIGDDGAEDIYTLVAGVYQPPAGVHDRLEKFDDPNFPSAPHFWRLTGPSQWKRIFDDNGGALDGLVVREIDSSGNTVHVDRLADGTLSFIRSAADGLSGDNRLEIKLTAGKLDWVEDPIGRQWTFTYDASDRLSAVNYPHDGYVDESAVEFTYNSHEQIYTVTSRDDLIWTYLYRNFNGVLKRVIDPLAGPLDPNDPNYIPPYEQDLEMVVTIGGGSPAWKRTIIDRRDYEWEYSFDSDGNLLTRKDPLNKTRTYTWDTEHNPLTFTDELSHTWTSTYGAVGNLLTLTSPLASPAQTWTLAWNPVGDPATTNFWQMAQVTDPAGKWTQYVYADPAEPNDPDDATLVTQVIEMPDGQGNPQAVTHLEYYDDSTPSALGQLKRVIDANGCASEYTYEDRGFVESLAEGYADPPAINHYPYETNLLEYDGVGRITGSHGRAIACFFYLDVDDNDRGGGPGGDNPPRLGNPPSPTMTTPGPSSGGPGRNPFGTITYTPAGLLEAIDIYTNPDNYVTALSDDFETERKYEFSYDQLNNLASIEITSKDAMVYGSTTLARMYDFPGYDAEGRLLQSADTDSVQTFYTYTERGALHTVTRDNMTATLTYDDAGRLTQLDYGNGTKEIRVYDDADRLTEIRHEDGLGTVLYKIVYGWTSNNWVDLKMEYVFIDEFAGVLITDFWAPYESVCAEDRQYCLVHLLRELEKVDLRNDSAEWRAFAKKLRRLLRDGIRLRKRADFAPGKFQGRADRLNKRLAQLASEEPADANEEQADGEPAAGERGDCDAFAIGECADKDVRRLKKRLRKYAEYIFTFLDHEHVPFKNNFAERQIRPAVILRKNSQSNRSQRGAATQAILMSVYRTLKLRGLNPTRTIANALKTYLTTGQLPQLPDANIADG